MTAPRGFALRLAIFYGALFLLLGAYLPYFPVWLDGRGLTAAQIAIVLATPAVARILFTPLVGFAADRGGDRRRVLRLLGWGSVLACAALVFADTFPAILVIATLFALCWTTVMPLTETLAMAGVRAAGLDYGRMRLWGSLAFVAASTGGGLAVEAWGGEAALGLIGVGAGAIAISAYWLPQPSGRGFLKAATAIPRLRIGDAVNLVRSPLFLLFLLAAGTVQAAHAVYYAFGTLHWQAQGISGGVIGLLWTAGVMAEVLLFTISRRAVTAVGPAGLIAIAGLAALLRWSLTAMDPPLWLLFLAQGLHGATFGAAHLGAVHFISEAVPEDYAATAQGLYASVTAGLMMGAATLAAGPLYAMLGAAAYLAMAAMGVVSALGAAVLMRHWRGGPLMARAAHQPHSAASGG